MSTWVIMPSDDDVIHGHKYIDKIMGPNGKWRYIYYRAKTKAKNIIGVGQKNRLDRANKNLDNANKYHEGSKYYTNMYKNNGDKEALNEAMKQNTKEIDNVQKAKRNQKNAQEAYNKTLLGKIDQVKDAGLKAWNSFTSLFKEGTKNNKTVTNNSRSKYGLTTNKYQYTPSYSTKKSPTTLTRRGGLGSSSKRNPGVAIGSDIINEDKKKKRRRA